MIIDRPTSAQIVQLRALWKEAFGDGEEFLDIFYSTAFCTERCRCISLEGRVVAALYWFDCSRGDEKIAYIYAVATSMAYRGRGLCKALMEDTHRHLREQDYALAMLVPGEESLIGFYAAMGYRVCTTVGEIECSAREGRIALRRISVNEYARRRRELLPAGGVLQEKENMRFLDGQAELYRTEDSLLACRIDNGRLWGLELLGRAEEAERILHALGFSEGRFRIPDGERPFAMYYPLTDRNITPPTYFGLAFD